MALHDDDMIIATPYDSGTKYESFKEGNTMITTMYKDEAGLGQNKLSVFLELTGAGYVTQRPGLDIVTVLDISNTMKGSKLSALKAAMRFLIDKLSSTDRLSVVTFSKHCQRLFPLRQMSVVSRAEIDKLVEGLDASYHGKDINGGLEMALQVINDRKYAHGRDAAIFVMSDGNQVQAPSQVSFGTLPVYTFGFVEQDGSMVLEDIAKKSAGGIFTPIHVGNSVSNNLNIAFSQCLSNLFTVVVTDLVITVERANSKTGIEKVCVGTYSQLPFTASEDGVKISYGNLYAKETCTVQLDLLLPSVTSEQSDDLLHISYSCRREDKVFNSRPRLIAVTRVGNRIPMGNDQQNKVEKPQGFFSIPKLPNIKTKQVEDSVEGATDKLKGFFGGWKLPKSEQTASPSMIPDTKQVEDSVAAEGTTEKRKGFLGAWNVPKSEQSAPLSMTPDTKQFDDSVVAEGIIDKTKGFLSGWKVPKSEQSVSSSVTPDTEQVEDSVVVEGTTEKRKGFLGGWNVPKSEQSASTSTIPDIKQDEAVTDDKHKGFSGLLKVPNMRSSPVSTIMKQGKEFSNVAVESAAGLMHGLFNRPAVSNVRDAFVEGTKDMDELRTQDRINVVESNISESIALDDQNMSNPRSMTGNNVEEIKIGDEENMTNLLKQALDSVKIIREILSDYVNQHIGFQVQNAESTDPIRASNIEALGEHITNTFDSVKAIEDILLKIGSKAINHENDEVIESSEAAPLAPIEDVHISEHTDPVENITAHVKEAFDSVKIIREILIDYVNQHAEFDATLSESTDPVRANNVKALGDRICCAFDSVKAIEDILMTTESTRSIVA